MNQFSDNPYESPIVAELVEPKRRIGWIAGLLVALTIEMIVLVLALIVQMTYWIGLMGDALIVVAGLSFLLTAPWLLLVVLVRSLRP